MKVDWAHLKEELDRGLHAAEKGEQGGVRLHCGSMERMLKAAKGADAKEMLDKVHHAKTSIEVSRSVDFLREAQVVYARMAP